MLPGTVPFKAPIWISTRIDDEAVEHYRSVGCFTPVEDREPLTVELVQRDDLTPDGAVHRNPAQIRVAGVRLSPDEARQLARLLNQAAMLVEEAAFRDRPRRTFRSINGGYGLAQPRAS